LVGVGHPGVIDILGIISANFLSGEIGAACLYLRASSSLVIAQTSVQAFWRCARPLNSRGVVPLGIGPPDGGEPCLLNCVRRVPLPFSAISNLTMPRDRRRGNVRTVLVSRPPAPG